MDEAKEVVLDQAEHVLVYHQRRDISSCICGWNKLGLSHARHQAQMLQDAGLLAAPK